MVNPVQWKEMTLDLLSKLPFLDSSLQRGAPPKILAMLTSIQWHASTVNHNASTWLLTRATDTHAECLP